jgi:predicted negative regulator of RcsB-dependent stress response
MAKRRPPTSRRSSGQGPASGNADDAFTAKILEFLLWARDRTQVLILAGVGAVVLIVGTFYFFNQRAERLNQAAQELEMVQFAAFTQEPQQGIAELRAYIDRFSGTPYALEAYLLMAELQLEDGQAEQAVAALQEIVPRYRSPLEVQATFLLAVALEEAERWEDASDLYEELLDRSTFTFQKREAAEGLARTHLARGNREAALEAYHSILEELDEDHPQRNRYEMRLAELEAQGV